jgi:phospholipid-transporting ATPase
MYIYIYNVYSVGNIQFILSDKTGTLTENEMRFHSASICGEGFRGKEGLDELGQMLKISHIEELEHRKSMEASIGESEGKVRDRGNEDWLEFGSYLKLFYRILTVCNAVVVRDPEGRAVSCKPLPEIYNTVYYTSESSDEVALVTALSEIGGVHMLGTRSGHKYISISKESKDIQHFEILAELPFSSEWKRQSVVVRTPEGEIWLYIKGADASIIPLCKQDVHIYSQKRGVNTNINQNTVDHLTEYSTDGLRTLVVPAYVYIIPTYTNSCLPVQVAAKRISEEEYSAWRGDYSDAQASTVDPDSMARYLHYLPMYICRFVLKLYI